MHCAYPYSIQTLFLITTKKSKFQIYIEDNHKLNVFKQFMKRFYLDVWNTELQLTATILYALHSESKKLFYSIRCKQNMNERMRLYFSFN